MGIINKNRIIPNIDDILSFLDEVFSNHSISKTDYILYKNRVNGEYYNQVRKTFPCLTIIHRDMKASYITGPVILKEDLDSIPVSILDTFKAESFQLFGYIPLPFSGNFSQKIIPIHIYDVYHCFNYDFLRTNYHHICHLDNIYNFPFYHVCTNKAKDISRRNYLFSPIAVARSLYLEYQKVDNGGVFELECYPHGGDYNE